MNFLHLEKMPEHCNEIIAKSILRKHKRIDSWFITHYGMNLYRGCSHNCAYCDGRAEKYYAPEKFGSSVEVKINASEILARELDPKRKRIPFKKSFMVLGGGVSDSYQSPEKDYMITRDVLKLLRHYDFPVFILTKSTLVERDIDLIGEINRKNGALVCFSFSSVDEKISAVFEPGVPSPRKRLDTIKKLRDSGISTGMFLMPVIPFVTDTPELLESAVEAARDNGIEFIIFGGMTLKDGRQKNHFLKVLHDYDRTLLTYYANLYRGDKWGNADPEYYVSLNELFYKIARRYKMPLRIPPKFYKNLLSLNDLAIVITDHIDYLQRMRGFQSPFGMASWGLGKLDQPLEEMKYKLSSIKGIGSNARKVVSEIIEKRSSRFYEDLLFYKR